MCGREGLIHFPLFSVTTKTLSPLARCPGLSCPCIAPHPPSSAPAQGTRQCHSSQVIEGEQRGQRGQSQAPTLVCLTPKPTCVRCLRCGTKHPSLVASQTLTISRRPEYAGSRPAAVQAAFSSGGWTRRDSQGSPAPSGAAGFTSCGCRAEGPGLLLAFAWRPQVGDAPAAAVLCHLASPAAVNSDGVFRVATQSQEGRPPPVHVLLAGSRSTFCPSEGSGDLEGGCPEGSRGHPTP